MKFGERAGHGTPGPTPSTPSDSPPFDIPVDQFRPNLDVPGRRRRQRLTGRPLGSHLASPESPRLGPARGNEGTGWGGRPASCGGRQGQGECGGPAVDWAPMRRVRPPQPPKLRSPEAWRQAFMVFHGFVHGVQHILAWFGGY